MEIVIDIPKDAYRQIRNWGVPTDELRRKIYDIIDNGKPLPEHHGRLIDADRLTRPEIIHLWYHLPNGDIACPKVDIDHAPTIIEGSDSE